MANEHNIPKTYDPAAVEKKWYRFWEEHKYFHAEPEPDKKPFTIVIPPPNITGQLHMGHALDNTLQDILIRFKLSFRSVNCQKAFRLSFYLFIGFFYLLLRHQKILF